MRHFKKAIGRSCIAAHLIQAGSPVFEVILGVLPPLQKLDPAKRHMQVLTESTKAPRCKTTASELDLL